MRVGLARIDDPEHGILIACIHTDDGSLYDISRYAPGGILGLIVSGGLDDRAGIESLTGPAAADRYPLSFDDLLNGRGIDGPRLLMPFDPVEVWGVGVSYRRAAELHEADLASRDRPQGLYDYVFQSARPEIFFKGLTRHCVGHNDFIGIRGDSQDTMVEAELACIFNRAGHIVAYTIANDVTAWDLERECPLFLSYAKTFSGSCAIGPCIVPAALLEPKRLRVMCRVERDGMTLYEAEGNTCEMHRSLDELARYLCAYNEVPDGTVLCTGTAVGIPNSLALHDGDRVTIEIAGLGRLSNVARRMPRALWEVT